MKDKEFEDKFIQALRDDGFDVEIGETTGRYVDNENYKGEYTTFMNGFPKVEGKPCEFGYTLNARKYDAEGCIAFTVHNLQFLKGTKITIRPEAFYIVEDEDQRYDIRPERFLFTACRLHSSKLDNIELSKYLETITIWDEDDE